VHYYQFNIKDYSFATMRMSLMEDLAFRRMLDLYYETEKPLSCELARIAKSIGMSEFQEEVRTVLNEFWQETDDGWINDRASIEIQKYKSKAGTARANGKLGGRPSKPKDNPEITQSVNLANPEETGLKDNHKPITNNQEPLTNKIPYQLIVDAFHGSLPELPKISKLNESRKKRIKHIWIVEKFDSPGERSEEHTSELQSR